MSNTAIDDRHSLATLLDRHPLSRTLDPATRRFLEERCRRVEFASGVEILEDGVPVENALLLLRGSVKLGFPSTTDGRQASAGVLRAPAAFGCAEALTGRVAPASLIAVERCLGLSIHRMVLSEAAARSPALSLAIVGQVAALEEAALQKLRETLFLPVAVRTARLFLEYVEAFGLPVAGGTKIRVRLSQDTVAAELGVARRSVTRALRAWQEEGLIRKEGGHFIVRDRARLAAFAELDPPARVYDFAQNSSTKRT